VPFTPTIPISPFDEKKTYIIKNAASGLALHGNGKAAKSTVVQAAGKKGEWQLLYDGKGYFTIKNRVTGMVLGAASDNQRLVQSANLKAENVKWHLEWDATGNCRIINKVNMQTLTNNDSKKANTLIAQITAPIKPDDLKTRDDLRWQIVEE
jgi:hypothetical protein